MSEPVLEAVEVTKHFTVTDSMGRAAIVRAVENATLRLHPGQIVALVGESGSGKTTLARLLARFYEPTSGEILLDGVSVTGTRRKESKAYHRAVQLIFQDPFGSLNPLHRIRYTLTRALKLHHRKGDTPIRDRVNDLLDRVSLSPADEFAEKFPHELSGGQRQRVVIARALAVQPRVLLGDEPISMLDVSIRLEMLNLLERLRAEDELAVLYITHDIASARYLCDQIVVMYAGQMIEGGDKEDVIAHPAHPYTRLLIDSSPDPARDVAATREELFGDADDLGEPPSLIDPPTGCRFHPRCPFAMEICRTQAPPRTELGGDRWTHCWLHQEGRAHELEETDLMNTTTAQGAAS